MTKEIEGLFLQLSRFGIDRTPMTNIPESVDWKNMFTIAESQKRLSGIVMDAMEQIPQEYRPEKKELLQASRDRFTIRGCVRSVDGRGRHRGPSGLEAHAQAAGVQGGSGLSERRFRGCFQSGHVPACGAVCER